MGIRTLQSQDRIYSKNRVTEPRKKLKKLRSVKVANLDRLRLSMRREKTRFHCDLGAASDDATGPSSETSSNPISGTSSPNYMKATTSSSARKGSAKASSGKCDLQSSSGSSSDFRIPARKNNRGLKKLNKISVEQCSDPAGVNIPVDIKAGTKLKRLSSVRKSKLSSKKSIKFRAKYSQFTNEGISDNSEPGSSSFSNPEFHDNDVIFSEDNPETQSASANASAKQKGRPERSRSIRLTRLRSIRRPKSRLSSEFQMSNAQRNYMKDTSSQEARKNYAKGLTRTTSLRPLRILAKIPSLRPRRGKVKKRPEVTPLAGKSIDRATCSSALKSSKLPRHIELESDERSSFDVCPYSYCSLHHRHHAPSQPLKEFISAKRQLFSNTKGKQLEHQTMQQVQHSTSVARTDHSGQVAGAGSHAADDVANARTADAPEVEDTGLYFLSNVYAKPRKKWAIEGTPSEDEETLNGSVESQVDVRDYERKPAFTFHEASRESLVDGQQGPYQIFSVCQMEPDDTTKHHTSTNAVSNLYFELPVSGSKSAYTEKQLEPFTRAEEIQRSLSDPPYFPNRDTEVRSGTNVINILSDGQKYNSIWNLIYQQYMSSEASKAEKQGAEGIDERDQGGDVNGEKMIDLDPGRSKYDKNVNADEDTQAVTMEKLEFDQNAAINLVQEALNALLQREEQSSDQQSSSYQEKPSSPAGEDISTPTASSQENARECGEMVEHETSPQSEDKHQKTGQIGAGVQHKAESNEGKMAERKMSKSLSKLKKMIVTAKFIKAMERLRKISPRKPQYLSPEPTSEEERIYLRHLSLKGRRNDEEWMLDHALRQVISKLAPDQQRRVGLLVEAFETVAPGQKEMGIRCYPMKGQPAAGIELSTTNGEPKQLVQSDLAITTSDKQSPQKQDNGVPLFCKGVSKEKSLRDEADILHSMSESYSQNPRSASVDDEFGEQSLQNEEVTSTLVVPPKLPTGDSEVAVAGDMTTILIDKQKYASMWNMIYRHVISSEVSVNGNKGISIYEEEEQGSQEMNDPDSTKSSYNTNHKDDGDDQSAAVEKHELDQSAAIKLVKEAVNAILQRYEQPSDSDQQFRQVHGRMGNEYSKEEDRTEEKHQVEKTSEELKQDVEPRESNAAHKKMPKSYSKLRRAIVTAKFIKAMERLQKISPQKSQYLSAEAATEEERVYLRHFSMDGRKTYEEWMLDYALREVISKLAPDQQRRVGILVEAFERVAPGQNEKSTRYYPVEGRPAPSTESPTIMKKEPVEFAEEISLRDKTDISHSTLGSFELHSRSVSIDTASEESSMGSTDAMRSLEVPSELPSGDSEVTLTCDTAAIVFDKRKYTNMWNLIYQHVVSSEGLVDGDNGVGGYYEEEHGSQEMNDLDSTQCSYSTNHREDENNQGAASEKIDFDQSAAIKLVKEAVNALLNRHQQSAREQYVPDRTTDENIEEEGKIVENDQEEKRREELKQNVQPTESKMTHRKMSKSISKLKRAIVTAKFIKAMERLRKISRQKSGHLYPEATSEEERVYLRHLSMDSRKNDEAWMLDFALRQVISKLAPDQQRKVSQLVEAFETVTPEQKKKCNRCHTLNSNSAQGIRLANIKNEAPEQFVESHQESCIADDLVPQKKNDGFLLSSIGTLKKRNLQEDHDHQESTTGDRIKQELHKTAGSDATLKLPEDSLKTISVEVALEESCTGDKETTSSGVPSQTREFEVSFASDMDAILSNKHNYTSMWNLIYQQVISSEASDAAKQGAKEVDGDEQGVNAKKCQVINDLEITQVRHRRNQTQDENYQSAAPEKDKFDQSAAIKLVKEAIDAILQSHDQGSDERLLQDHDLDNSSGRELYNTTAPKSPEENSTEAKQKERCGNSELKDELHKMENTNVPLQQWTERNGVKTSQEDISNSCSKLKKLIITAKFIKTMERMRRISTTRSQHLPPQVASEEERVHLRHQTTNERRNNEEWMLDYALRKVICDLSPDQQRRVALLIKAFERVTPEQKDSDSKKQIKAGPAAGIADPEQYDSTSYEDRIPHKHDGEISQLGKDHELERSVETHPKENTNFNTKLQEKVLDAERIKWQINQQDCPKVKKEETESNLLSEPLEQACSRGEPEQVSEVNTEKDMYVNTQQRSTMWNLIYQHVKSVGAVETGDKLADGVANTDQTTPGDKTMDDADDSDASSVTSELAESDAIKLVKEAIDNILDTPQKLEEDQRAAVGEKQPQKSLSRGYSKLRKLIICNKFIKAMEKMQKSQPQKRKSLLLVSDVEPEKTHLRPCTVGEKKSTDNWMLDNALQKVISGLAPVQQRRVAMLVKAFEKVNPDLEETENGLCCIEAKSRTTISVAGNADGKVEQIAESPQNSSSLPGGFDDVEQENSVANSSRHQEGINVDRSPSSSKQDWRTDGPSRTATATSDAVVTSSNVHKNPTENKSTEMPHSSVSLEDRRGRDLVRDSDTDNKFATTSLQPEDEWTTSIENKSSLDGDKPTSLWCLLVKHIKADESEKTEKRTATEINTNAQVDGANLLSQRNNDNPNQNSPEFNHERDIDFQTPKSMSFEFRKKEAVKLVKEALDEILLLPDQTCDDQTSDHYVSSESREDGGNPLSGAEELQDGTPTPQNENKSAKENSPNSFSSLSKVILCKRFITAMDKMRKLKPQSPQYNSQQMDTKSENSRPIRQIAATERKDWEEWMLDSAMQQVVGKLAPAQKKKVALLVQAFETVGSQPEPSIGQRVKVAAV